MIKLKYKKDNKKLEQITLKKLKQRILKKDNEKLEKINLKK